MLIPHCLYPPMEQLYEQLRHTCTFCIEKCGLLNSNEKTFFPQLMNTDNILCHQTYCKNTEQEESREPKAIISNLSYSFNIKLSVLPDHQPLSPLREKVWVGSAYLHSSNLSSESGLQGPPCPEFEHMPKKQLSHY